MTQQWKPEWQDQELSAQDVSLTPDNYRALMQLRATCLDAPLNMGFLARRAQNMGMILLSEELMAYAEKLKAMAEAADDKPSK